MQFSAIAETVKDAVAIPRSALLTGDRGTGVMVVDADSVAHQRGVETGITAGDQVQITKGLEGGERVVTTGAFGLPDGTKVSIETTKPEGNR